MRAQPLQLCKAMHSSKAQQCKALSTTRQRSGSSRPARHSRQHMLQSTRCLSLAAAAQPVAQVAEGGVLTDLLTVTLTGGIIAGITLSALPLLSGRAQESPLAVEDEEEETVQWSVMGVVSCIPLINWTAWVFAALNSDAPTGYYALAALYAAPWLKEGLRLDGFTLLTLLACAAHVQVERIKATEPSVVAPIGTGGFEERAQASRKALEDSTSAVKDRLEETVKGGKADAAEIARRGQGARVERTERELREAEEALASQELERWDEVFRSQSEQKDNSR